MKRILIASSLLLLVFYSCSAKKQAKANAQTFAENVMDTVKPKTNYSVHKTYDKDGNLVSMDSTYSYMYSSKDIDSKKQAQIFKQFKEEMNQNFPSFQDDFFNGFFGNNNINDSIFKGRFYSPNFFFNLQNGDVQKLLKHMDTLKNEFYKAQINNIKKQV